MIRESVQPDAIVSYTHSLDRVVAFDMPLKLHWFTDSLSDYYLFPPFIVSVMRQGEYNPGGSIADVVQLCKEIAMTVNTAKVTGRRQLHFSSVDEILADVQRLAAVPHRLLGNWSFGQILWHLATVMNSSIDGSSIRPGFFMRLLGPLMKGHMLSKGMSPGFKLPANMLKVFGPPPTSAEDGLKVFREAIRRQKTETHREPSPFLGKMTDAEYVQLHCRHAELHLSFVVPAE